MLPLTSRALASLSPSRLQRLACPARVAFEQGTPGAGRSGPAAELGAVTHRAIELTLEGEDAQVAWARSCDEVAASGADPRNLPSARRYAARFRKRMPAIQAFVDSLAPAELKVEQRLVSPDGEIEGTPDLVLVRENDLIVVDHKTSLVTHDDEEPRREYVQQLRIYAGLAEEAYGVPARRCVLMSTREGAVEVEVSPQLIAESLTEARSAREEFNDRVPGPQPAAPSPENCQWCRSQPACDAFWGAVDEAWTESAGECVQVEVTRAPERAATGAISIRGRVTRGTLETGADVVLAAIDADCFPRVERGQTVAATRFTSGRNGSAVLTWSERSSIHASG